MIWRIKAIDHAVAGMLEYFAEAAIDIRGEARTVEIKQPFGVVGATKVIGAVDELAADVINVISGPGPTTGGALAAHPDVKKLSFTGSKATGK